MSARPLVKVGWKQGKRGSEKRGRFDYAWQEGS